MIKNTGNPPETPVINVNTRVAPTAENPCGYPPFNICFIPIYTNNQLCYYHMIGAMLGADKTALRSQLEDRKTSLELVNWDGNSRPNTPVDQASNLPINQEASNTIPFRSFLTSQASSIPDETDSDCPAPIAGQKGLRFNSSNIMKL